MTSPFFRSYVLKREAAGHYGDDGIYVPGTVTTTSVSATVQPASLTDYDRVKNEHAGLALDGLVKVYTETRLIVGDKRDASGSQVVNGDIIVTPSPENRQYRIIGVSAWQVGSTIDHYKYLAALVQPTPK